MSHKPYSYHGGGQEHEHEGHQGQVQEADDQVEHWA